MLISTNPASDTRIEGYERHSPAEVDAILDETARAGISWESSGFGERAGLLRAVAGILRNQREDLARLMALEMGKPVRQGRAEIDKCALNCDYYADNGEAFLSPERVNTEASHSYIACRPLGLILAVMPWNFPFWQVFRFIAPALMAGNTAVLKHASNVTGCALAIEEVFRQAGMCDSLFRTLRIGSDAVAQVIDHPQVRAVTLTGSGPAGRAVAARAGAALKKTVLELGGSDPYLILEDADLDHAARVCVDSRLINGGQSCIAAKRFIVVESVRAGFEDRMIALMQQRNMTDPLSEDSDIGPQARVDLRDELHQQVESSVALGAICRLGGEIPERPGAWYPPTLLANVKPGMPAFDEELFGPVAAVISAADEREAIRLANQSPFGLGAAVFTRDSQRGERIARDELQAGCCFVNDLVKSDPRLPFGGIRESGYGRELSQVGIREFVNLKTVWVR